MAYSAPKVPVELAILNIGRRRARRLAPRRMLLVYACEEFLPICLFTFESEAGKLHFVGEVTLYNIRFTTLEGKNLD